MLNSLKYIILLDLEILEQYEYYFTDGVISLMVMGMKSIKRETGILRILFEQKLI